MVSLAESISHKSETTRSETISQTETKRIFLYINNIVSVVPVRVPVWTLTTLAKRVRDFAHMRFNRQIKPCSRHMRVQFIRVFAVPNKNTCLK